MYVFPDTGSGGALQPNLASIVGAIPAGYNMLPTPGGRHGFQTDWTDFTNAGTATFHGWSVTGTEFSGTVAQLTFVTGLSGPDHSANATKLVETTFNGNHAVYAFANGLGGAPPSWNGIDAPIPFRVAAIVRANERTRAVLSFDDGNIILHPAYAISIGFDLAGMNVGYDNAVGANNTLLGTHISDLGGGWRLIYFDWVVSSGALTPASPSNNTPQPAIKLDNGSGTAARSISYAGNGTSGLEVLWFNILPVAMWNMIVKAFEDDFHDLSTIDLTNSLAPGFNWYINNRFPNSGKWGGGGGNVNFWNDPVSNIPTPASSFSIPSPSIMQMTSNTPSNGFIQQFWSVGSSSNVPGTVPGFVGTAFRAPMFVEYSFVTDGPNEFNLATYNPYWQGDGFGPFGSGMQTLTDVGWPADGLFDFVEWDMGGAGNPVRGELGGGAGTLEWRNPGAPFYGQGLAQLSLAAGDIAGHLGNPDFPPFDKKYGFRKVGSLWVNAAYNNYSWGFFMVFSDGQWRGGSGVGLRAYSASGNLSSGAPIIGINSLIDGVQMPLLFTSCFSNNAFAPNAPIIKVDWVRVWNPPAIPIVYAFWNAYDMGTFGAAGLLSTFSQNGYQVTKPGSDASWQSARTHKCIGYNNVGLSFYTGVSTGKWYWEHTLTGNSVGNTSDFMLGFGNTGATVVNSNPGGSAKGAGLQYNTAANTNVNGVTGLTASAITWVANDVIGFAFDADAGHVYVHKNGTYINGNPGSGNGVWTVSGDTWWPMVAMKTAGSTNAVSSNFGQKAFAFTVPSGYNAGVF